MKRLLFIAVTAILFSFTSTGDSTVYMCNNGKTEVYHIDYECRAMKKCTHDIVELTLVQAKKKGLRLCGYED